MEVQAQGNKTGNKGLDLLAEYIFYKNYSQPKANGELENWEESIDRIYSMHRNFLISKGYSPAVIDPILKEGKEFEKKKKFLSSQRGRQFASPKFDEGILKHHTKIFNCSSTPINRPEVFKEIMYLLLSGCGVGISVVKHFVNELPPIAEEVIQTNTIYSIPDSIEGWADAIDHLMNAAFTNGLLPNFDYGQIREKGELINGKFKAPGHEPLKRTIDNIKTIIFNAQGRKLRPLEAHRIVCFIAESVLSGGVRRSSIISLFSKDDEEMLSCKTGDWYNTNRELAMANNSVHIPYNEHTTRAEYKKIFEYIKQYGEPGIVRTDSYDIGTNP